MTDNSNAAPERYGDLERNRLLNQCSCDLEGIIYDHDPEIHNLNNRVWDRLDKLALDIEARTADLARAQIAAAYERAERALWELLCDDRSEFWSGHTKAVKEGIEAMKSLADMARTLAQEDGE